MIPSMQILVDQGDMDRVTAFMDNMGRRASREQLQPILMQFLEPMVAKEKSFLSGHSESGALVASLAARAGSGDRPGTISVFSAATATSAQLAATWGKSTPQKKGYMSRITKKGKRRSVFYADFVEKGHRIVKRSLSRGLYVAGVAQPVPFASSTVAEMGDEQADAAAVAVMNYIVDGE